MSPQLQEWHLLSLAIIEVKQASELMIKAVRQVGMCELFVFL